MKRIILAALVGVLVSGLSPPVAGQSLQEGVLAGTWRIHVRLETHVRDDDCLSNPDAIKNAAELKFLANGIKIVEGDNTFLSPFLIVNLTGYALRQKDGYVDGCVVNVDMSLFTTIWAKLPFGDIRDEIFIQGNLTPLRVWFNGFLLTGTKKEMQSYVKRLVEDATEELILKILKTREKLFAEHPKMKKNFEAINK